jgi:hypothetical protein
MRTLHIKKGYLDTMKINELLSTRVVDSSPNASEW